MGERYNRRCRRHTLPIMGVEGNKKETAASSQNSITIIIILSHLRGNSHRSRSQRDKGTFKHSHPGAVRAQRGGWGCEFRNGSDWWDARGQWIERIESGSGTEGDRDADRKCWSDSREIRRWQSLCIWSLFYDLHVWMHTGDKGRADRSGNRRSSVISVSRLWFLIADMAAVGWMWKKQKDRGAWNYTLHRVA